MNNFKTLLINEVKRRLMEEGTERIKQCIDELTLDEIWFRPNENSNSVGNLVLHLCGNVRQWVVSGLGQHPDVRDRATEFNENGPIAKETLNTLLDNTMNDVEKTLDNLTQEAILSPVVVQGFEETGLSVLVHVVEHFSYHVGQITYFVKWRKNIDTAYYGGLELDDFGDGKT